MWVLHAKKRDRPLPNSKFNELDAFQLCLSRRSTRGYDPEHKLEPEIVEDVKKYLADDEKMTGPFKTRIRIEFLDCSPQSNVKLGTYGVINNAHQFLAGIVTPTSNNLDFGYVFEMLVLHLTKLGLSTIFIAGTFKEADFLKAVKITGDEKVMIVCPFGYPSTKNSFIGGMMTSMLGSSSAKRPDLSTVVFHKAATPATAPAVGYKSHEEAGALGPALEAARWAPSAGNQCPTKALVIEKDETHPTQVHFFRTANANHPIDWGIFLANFALVAQETSKLAGAFSILVDSGGSGAGGSSTGSEREEPAPFPTLGEKKGAYVYLCTWTQAE